MAYDEETGEQGYKEVVRLFGNETTEWYHIHVNDEDIACTAEHPFYVADRKEFLPARELKIGDRVLLSDGECAIITEISVEHLTQIEPTYNFQVEGYHTYYVTESCILTHNKCWGTVRRNYWKARAESADALDMYGHDNLKLMKQGKAPIGADGRKIELHHVFGKKNDLYTVVEMTRSDHIAFHKQYGYRDFINIFETDSIYFFAGG